MRPHLFALCHTFNLVRTPPKQVNLQPFLPPETGPNDPTHLIDPPVIKDFLPNVCYITLNIDLN